MFVPWHGQVTASSRINGRYSSHCMPVEDANIHIDGLCAVDVTIFCSHFSTSPVESIRNIFFS